MGSTIRVHELEMLQAAVGITRHIGQPEPSTFGPGQLLVILEQVAQVAVGPSVREYLVSLAAATRSHRQVTLGLSPRALLTWQRVAQARAFLGGRDYVTPDDVQDVARPVMEVRLGVEPDAMSRVLAEILDSVTVPLYPR
jgi:MoxR-like ATPase